MFLLQAMQRARRRKRKDYDVTTNDDEIMVVIDKMRQAANVSPPEQFLSLNNKFIYTGRQATKLGSKSCYQEAKIIANSFSSDAQV